MTITKQFEAQVYCADHGGWEILGTFDAFADAEQSMLDNVESYVRGRVVEVRTEVTRHVLARAVPLGSSDEEIVANLVANQAFL